MEIASDGEKVIRKREKYSGNREKTKEMVLFKMERSRPERKKKCCVGKEERSFWTKKKYAHRFDARMGSFDQPTAARRPSSPLSQLPPGALRIWPLESLTSSSREI